MKWQYDYYWYMETAVVSHDKKGRYTGRGWAEKMNTGKRDNTMFYADSSSEVECE